MKRKEDKDGMVNVNIHEFPGFYNSLLSGGQDMEEDQEAEFKADYESDTSNPNYQDNPDLRLSKDNYAEIMFACTDYQKIYLDIAQRWLEAFDDWFREHIGTPRGSFKFETMTSPREYNFSTDRLFAWVPIEVIQQMYLISRREKHLYLKSAVKCRFTSRQGFLSFYSNNVNDLVAVPLEDWDHNQYAVLISAMVDKYTPAEGDFALHMYYRTFDNYHWSSEFVDMVEFEKRVAAKRQALREQKSEE